MTSAFEGGSTLISRIIGSIPGRAVWVEVVDSLTNSRCKFTERVRTDVGAVTVVVVTTVSAPLIRLSESAMTLASFWRLVASSDSRVLIRLSIAVVRAR